ncbi:MAG: hypothetical protein MR300_11010, partial [Ruminococcus sp.]|nr:hypothetical protein [Ruminococcus sp.]
MKFLKKFSAIVISIVIMLSIAVLNVSATTIIQDGLEVILTTDKDNYSKDDQIIATLSVKNTTNKNISNVSLENVIPSGYKLANSSKNTKQLTTLNPNEIVELRVVYVDDSSGEIDKVNNDNKINQDNKITKNNEIINTGDNLLQAIILVIAIVLSILLIIICLKNNKGKKILSLLLTISLIGSLLSITQIKVYAIEKYEKSLKIENSILIDGNHKKIESVVKYLLLNTNNVEQNEQNIIQQIKASGLDNIDNWKNFADNNNNGVPDKLDSIMGFDTDNYDSDEDGLPDFIEEMISSDKYNPDSDGDKLPDGYEIFTLHTMPTKNDSNDNGISDADEDFDKDGLSNLEEYLLKINPNDKDTDGDTLSDFDEIKIYQTDPLNKDSDKDGLRDGDEIKYKMDPFNPDTLNDGIFDGDRIFSISLDGEISDNKTIKPNLKIEISGKQIESLDVNKIENTDTFLNKNIPGYLGNAYDLTVDGKFNKATISFEIDSKYFEDDDFIPAVYYWNSENQSLTELSEQHLDGNTIIADLSHFSSYIVLDKH